MVGLPHSALPLERLPAPERLLVPTRLLQEAAKQVQNEELTMMTGKL